MDVRWADIVDWVNDERGWATFVAAVVLLLIAWTYAQIAKRRQVARLLAAVDDTTVGRYLPHVRTGAWGFAVTVAPPPEPFREFHVSFRARHPLDFVDWPALWARRERPRLQLAGTLPRVPEAELLWVRGRPPLTLVGTQPGRGPWVQQRLATTRAEYATRGANTAALRHAFADLHARFYAKLELVTVQRDHAPHVRLVFEGRVDPRDLSPLLASLRGIGRAAGLG